MSIDCKSYSDLEKEAQAVDRFTLDFRTPTYLASLNSNYHWMVPDPVKVFCSLMRRWNQFSDSRRFSKEEYVAYKDWLQKNVGVSRYTLQTRIGQCVKTNKPRYSNLRTIQPHNKITHMLAHYAEYTNIGGNKTAAYGQTKLIT